MAGTTTDLARFQADAEAVAAEHGHTLGEWYTSEHLLTAALCTGCTATVCLRAEGAGSNADPTRWLTAHDCQPVHERFYARKSTLSPVTNFVFDRENPTCAIAMRRKAPALKALLAQLNGGDVVDEHAKALAKVVRLRTQLMKAEAALEAVAA